MRVIAGFILKQLWLRIRGKYHRFGYAAVSFGAPLSLAQFVNTEPELVVEHLAEALMTRIADGVPVLPVPLVARALLQADAPMTRPELEQAVWAQMEALPRAHVHLPRSDRAYATEVGLRQLVRRKMVVEEGGRFAVAPADRAVVAYYAKSIAHLFRTGSM